ncbi:hypothetical protein HPP92_001574 [Vanilla planifolia]|uniref:Filament-like plant protein 4 n=1 Tax=Vanilla planifolia TaxID=51239 RepID=A0A835VH25_VANPL|nr:hypothetical protein HPP92_001574 [Vanilla planifolia]
MADPASASLSNCREYETEKDDAMTEKYVQITMESYTHLAGLEDQLKNITEQLLSAQAEMTAKDNLVKQHARVAEEAVSGWEKAEAEALALKLQLESLTLSKLSAEEKALHLDGALKECMKQIRNVKEESEQKLHDVVFAKTKQWEKSKVELDARIIDFEQQLQKASAENSALSRSLQERSSLLIKVSEEKCQADAQIEVLRSDICSCEREINSIRYELHVVSKELEIRNEEKNMSMRSAEVANKQHLEDVKKIAKLEVECQRLRGLVRKKLPGPAALAQMKLEVENVGRDNVESKLRKSSSKNSSPSHVSQTEFSLGNIQHFHKDNEFLKTRLLAMEEEMKTLMEALSSRNSELQASRNVCAKQASKIRSMENQMLVLSQQKNPSKSSIELRFENESNPPSLTSISEDGIDEDESCSESWTTALISDLLHAKKENDGVQIKTSENSSHLELMDDFLEMEKLACLSTKRNVNMNIVNGLKVKNVEATSLDFIVNQNDTNKRKCIDATSLATENALNEKNRPLLKLKSSITSVFEPQAHELNFKEVIENIGLIIQDAHVELLKEANDLTDDLAKQKESHKEAAKDVVSMKQDVNLCTIVYDQQLKDAIFHIHEFVLSLRKDAAEIEKSSNDVVEVVKKIEYFSASVDKLMCCEASLLDFILVLSHILREVSNLGYKMWTKGNERESNGSEYIDKETLSVNEVNQHDTLKECLSGDSLVPHFSTNSEFEGSISVGDAMKTTLPALSLEEFQNLKLEKEKVEMDLDKCKEMLDQTNLTLVQTEEQLSELKSELASCQKLNSLSETQLKCMAESYKLLESQKEELEARIGSLHSKAETLDNELQDERHRHQEDIAKCKELQELLERGMKCSTCSFPSNVDAAKTQHEIDIASAAGKLAECQETILLLGKQLQAMRNTAEPMDSSPKSRPRQGDALLEETDAGGLTNRPIYGQRVPHKEEPTEQTNEDSPLNEYNSQTSPYDSESSPFPKSPISSKHQKQKPYRSSSPSTEKYGRGFSRFFSKGKAEQ